MTVTQAKYDIKAIRERMQTNRSNSGYYAAIQDNDVEDDWAILRHVQLRQAGVWVPLAKDLYANLDAAFPRDTGDKCVEYGDSLNLACDAKYSQGYCDIPDPTIPINEAYVRLWDPTRKWPLWVFFTPNGVEFCKTSRERKGTIFAMKPFLKWGWESPHLFEEVNHWLKAIGFGADWAPDREVLA